MAGQAAQKLHPDDEVMTLSEDGKTAEVKKPPTEEELRKSAQTDGDEGDDDGDEDERHAAGSGGTAEELEARRAARRDARRSRKQHRRQREIDREAELTQMREELAAVRTQMGGVVQTSANQTIAIVDQRISEAGQARDLADAAIEAAITNKDGKAAREAMKARDLAIDALRQLGDYKVRYEASTKQQPAQQGPTPVLVNFARQFKQDNPWVELSPEKADDDSKKVHRLDASVKAAGYDPNTPEYWEELQDRVDRAFPSKLSAMADEDEGAETDTQQRRAQASVNGQRRGPAMGGGRSATPLGKNDVVIPNEVKEAAIAAGYWKDPADRADFIKRWKASSEKYGARK